MTPEQSTRMFSLCQRIAEENDRAVFLELVRELNGLLNQKDDRLLEADQQKTA